MASVQRDNSDCFFHHVEKNETFHRGSYCNIPDKDKVCCKCVPEEPRYSACQCQVNEPCGRARPLPQDSDQSVKLDDFRSRIEKHISMMHQRMHDFCERMFQKQKEGPQQQQQQQRQSADFKEVRVCGVPERRRAPEMQEMSTMDQGWRGERGHMEMQQQQWQSSDFKGGHCGCGLPETRRAPEVQEMSTRDQGCHCGRGYKEVQQQRRQPSDYGEPRTFGIPEVRRASEVQETTQRDQGWNSGQGHMMNCPFYEGIECSVQSARQEPRDYEYSDKRQVKKGTIDYWKIVLNTILSRSQEGKSESRATADNKQYQAAGYERCPIHSERAPVCCHSTAVRYDSRPAQYESRNAQYESRNAQYDSRPVQYESRPAQYDSRPAQYESRPAQYDCRPAQYESRPAQYESRPAQYESRNAQYESRPAQYESRNVQFESGPITYEAKLVRRESCPAQCQTRGMQEGSRTMQREMSPCPHMVQQKGSRSMQRDMIPAQTTCPCMVQQMQNSDNDDGYEEFAEDICEQMYKEGDTEVFRRKQERCMHKLSRDDAPNQAVPQQERNVPVRTDRDFGVGPKSFYGPHHSNSTRHWTSTTGNQTATSHESSY